MEPKISFLGMSRAPFILLLLSLALFVSGHSVFNCTKPNDCSFVDPGYSFCREGECRQCDPTLRKKDCQCPLNQYCISDKNNVDWGYCADVLSEPMIGATCNRNLTNHWESVTQGINDAMFCGHIVFNETTGAPLVLEWQGVCIMGICSQCSSIPIPSVPFAYCEDGRSCRYDGVFTIAPSGMLSWSYFWYQPMEVSFFVLLVFATASIIVCIGLMIYSVIHTRNKLKKE